MKLKLTSTGAKWRETKPAGMERGTLLTCAAVALACVPHRTSAGQVHQWDNCVFSIDEFGNLTRAGECTDTAVPLRLGRKDILSLSPDVFRHLSAFTVLELDYNRLTRLPGPGIFRDCKSLEALSLTHNELVAVPPIVFYGVLCHARVNKQASGHQMTKHRNRID